MFSYFALNQLKNWPQFLVMNHNDDQFYGTGGQKAKPCRACSDFKQWTQMQSKSMKNQNKNSISHQSSDERECPLSRDQLGRNSWSVLHTIAAYYPKEPTADQQKDIKLFIETFSRFYPCKHCAEDFQKDIVLDPPQTQSQQSLSQWFCRIHNNVNKKLDKKLFDCNRVDERWLKGWSDGSCD